MDAIKAIGAILTGAAAAGTGSIPVATITTSAPGILGAIGFTTTTTVVLPAAGIVAAAGLIGLAVYKGMEVAQRFDKS